MYVHGHVFEFACIVAVLTNHSDWIIVSYKHKNFWCVMCEVPEFDRKVWFANCLRAGQ